MKFEKLVWDLQRFGVLSTSRLSTEKKSSILVNSIPKSGTHLIERLICLLPGYYRPFVPTITEQNYPSYKKFINGKSFNKVYVAHLGAGLINDFDFQGYRLLVIRDPRSVLLSRMNYIKNTKNHIFRTQFDNVHDRNELFEKCLNGVPGTQFYSLEETFSSFSGEIESSLVIKFEDLIGSKGGGDEKEQLQTIDKILQYLEFDNVVDLSQKLKDKIFSSSSPTFNKPQIDSWKYEFSDVEIERVNETLENKIFEKYYSKR